MENNMLGGAFAGHTTNYGAAILIFLDNIYTEKCLNSAFDLNSFGHNYSASFLKLF